MIKEELGETFQETPIEGIVGLGFPALAASGTVPFFDTVIHQKVLKRNCFAFYLTSWKERTSEPASDPAYVIHSGSQDSEASGVILWGGFDRDLLEDEIKWVP